MPYKIALQPVQRIVRSASLCVRRVVPDERRRQRRDKGVHRKRLVNDAFAEMHALDMAKLSALEDRELVEPALDVVPLDQVAARLADVKQQVFVIALNRCFPEDAVLRLHRRIV